MSKQCMNWDLEILGLNLFAENGQFSIAEIYNKQVSVLTVENGFKFCMFRDYKLLGIIILIKCLCDHHAGAYNTNFNLR